jgi:thymidylate synthase
VALPLARRAFAGTLVYNARWQIDRQNGMQQYLDLMRHVLEQGPQGRPHRHRHALGVRLADALRPGRRFPAADDQEAAPASIIHELLWFLQGDTNIRYLRRTASASGTNGPT